MCKCYHLALVLGVGEAFAPPPPVLTQGSNLPQELHKIQHFGSISQKLSQQTMGPIPSGLKLPFHIKMKLTPLLQLEKAIAMRNETVYLVFSN